MRCPHCHADVSAKAQFCSQCGESLDAVPQRRFETTESRPKPHPLASDLTDDDEERELWRGTYSAKGMINYWLVAIAATIALPSVGAYASLDRVGWIGLLALLAVLWLGLFIMVGFQKLDVHYVLTNQRLMHRSGILTRHSHRIEVIDIDDVSYRQGIIERLFGVGTITILSSDHSDPELELPGIDHVHEVAAMMDEARRAERVRRGLHIEAI